MGRFLRGYYQKTGTTQWPTIYMSLYLRPRQTFSAALHGMGDIFPGEPKLHHDVRLIEKHFGATNLLDNHGGILSDEFARNMKVMSDHTYNLDPYATPNVLGESTKDTFGFIKSFIDGTLARDINEDKDDFLFLVHGAVIRDFLMTWFHVPLEQRSKIDGPGNCDVIELSGDFGKGWTATKIYDGEKMKPANKNVIRRVKSFTVFDLPPVPDHLKLDFDLL